MKNDKDRNKRQERRIEIVKDQIDARTPAKQVVQMHCCC